MICIPVSRPARSMPVALEEVVLAGTLLDEVPPEPVPRRPNSVLLEQPVIAGRQFVMARRVDDVEPFAAPEPVR